MSVNAANWKSIYKIGGIAVILQLVVILGYSTAYAVLGPKPASAAEYFAIWQTSPLEIVLRGDFLLLILIGLYLGTFSALYMALKRVNPIYSALATLFTIMAVVLTFGSESTFSLLHLVEKYAAAGSDALRAQFLAAGEAVIATDMWHTSGAYMTGILLQGSGVLISIIMLRSDDFSKVTAISGLLANAFDLVQHLLHPFWPGISEILTMFMVVYFVWYVMLGRDLFRLAKKSALVLENSPTETQGEIFR
jgi:hypothetical protein